jgi:alkylhydroperoxidase family enzyme
VLVCATAASLGDSYCALAWGNRSTAQADVSSTAAVLNASHGGALDEREHALAAWARKVVADPNATESDDVDALRGVGLSEREIFEATVFIAFRLAFSTVNHAASVEPDRQLADAAPSEVRQVVGFGRRAART